MFQAKSFAVLAVLCGSTLVAGCRTSAQTGSLVGAGLGTAIGSAVGYHNGDRTAGMLIGGAVGALGGYAVGNEIDKGQSGYRYEGEPRYEPDYRPAPYVEREPERVIERRYYYAESPPPRVIYRERYIYAPDGCRRCR